MRKIYFAHPKSKRGTKREERIIKILTARGYKVINPFDYEYCESMPRNAVLRDKCLYQQCDEIFCWFPKNHSRKLGTAIELMWAYKDSKYITVLTYAKHHDFLDFYANKVFYCYQAFLHDNEYIFK